MLFGFFLSYILQNSFSVLCASYFNNNMLWRGSILVSSVWCAGAFLCLEGQIFLEIWEISSYYFVESIMYPFALYLFSIFDAHSSLVWSFDRVAELFHSLFTALELFD
jgi:hypothetical protein